MTDERELVRADGRYVYVLFAAHSEDESVTGRRLVLYMVLEPGLPAIDSKPASHASAKPLTPRELEIIGAIARGHRWHEIASDLFITQSTVKTHVRNAMKKLGARTQAQLVAIALVSGMLDPASAVGEARSIGPRG